VRGFARYLSGIDPRTEIPRAGMVRIPRRWRPPFIYTDADVLALMERARVSIPQPLRAATYETLIGLLAATGLRIGEALRLDRSDVNWGDGVLHIRRSKFLKSRLVPLLASTVEALERYDHHRRRLCPVPSTESLFVSLRGTRVIYETVWPTHRMLCEQAGVGSGSAFSPRIHDHRHTFAVKTLLAWYRDGVDVQARLPWLSTYSRAPRAAAHLPLRVRCAGPARARCPPARRDPAGGDLVTMVAPTLQAFFTDRLTRQLQASPRTIASYRDTLRLLLSFAHERTGKQPSSSTGTTWTRRSSARFSITSSTAEPTASGPETSG
jgi:site-specific recombinase XerC